MKINQESLKQLTKKSLLEYEKLFPVLKKEKNKQYGILALTFFTLTIVGIFALNPTVTTIVELQKKLEDARLVESQLSQKISNLQLLGERYRSLAPEIELVQSALPQRPEPIQVIGQINQIAQSSGISVSGFRIGTIAITGGESPSQEEGEAATAVIQGGQYYTLELVLTGSYPNIRTFLTSLNGFNRLVSVKSMSITRNPGETGTVQLTLEATTYFKKITDL